MGQLRTTSAGCPCLRAPTCLLRGGRPLAACPACGGASALSLPLAGGESAVAYALCPT